MPVLQRTVAKRTRAAQALVSPSDDPPLMRAVWDQRQVPRKREQTQLLPRDPSPLVGLSLQFMDDHHAALDLRFGASSHVQMMREQYYLRAC